MISIFKNISQSHDGEKTSVEKFYNDVKFGTWKETFKRISSIENKKARQEAKKKDVPYVTISGLFNHRAKDGLVKHSGFICLDIDDVPLDEMSEKIEQIKNDLFCFCLFKSISGKGFSVIVKIEPKRHLDAFLGLEVYFAKKYELYLDKSCKDISRARFVSYDPDAFLNLESEKFTNYIPKSDKITKAKLPNVITGVNDMDFIINQIADNRLDLTNSNYLTWIEIGFALSEEFGEGGREYFHNVSYYSEKYDQQKADKQFDHCLKHKGSGITLATFFYHAKNSGVAIVSPETKKIVTVAAMTKNAERGFGDAVRVLQEVEGISPEVSTAIVQKVYQREDLSEANRLSKLDSLEIFINSNYDIKKNEVTRFYEQDGDDIDTSFLNSIYIRARKEVDDKIKFDEIDRLIGSDFTPSFNPLIEYFQRNAHLTPSGEIEKLINSVESVDPYKNELFKKWLVGVVASIHGDHSPLLLVLTGGINAGKTEFFRRLVPKELKRYYAESKLDAGKDDEILMCQKFLIMDDEFGGKSKVEAKRLKELTSKQYFDLREPYGRKNVNLRRLAVLCGTTNDELLLNDPTGNRRIIPISVLTIDRGKYNAVDTKLVFMEAFHLWKSGYNWQMTNEDIKELNDNTAKFEQIRPEKELILRYFKSVKFSDSSDNGIENMQAIEIKSYIERLTNQKLSTPKIAQELKHLGYISQQIKINGHIRRVYPIVKVTIEENAVTSIYNPYDQKNEVFGVVDRNLKDF